MTRKTLAAALNVAWVVAKVDGMDDKEWEVVFKELGSFRLDDKTLHAVIEEFKLMDPIDAINILRSSDEAAQKEAQALTFVTICADGKISDKELGALLAIANLCSFKKMTLEEAHKILGF